MICLMAVLPLFEAQRSALMLLDQLAAQVLANAAEPHLNCKVGADALNGIAHVHVLVDGHDVRLAGRHAL